MKIFIAISKKLAADQKNDRTNIGRIESFLFFQKGRVYSQALNLRRLQNMWQQAQAASRQVKSTRHSKMHSKSDFALTMNTQHQGIELKGYKNQTKDDNQLRFKAQELGFWFLCLSSTDQSLYKHILVITKLDRVIIRDIHLSSYLVVEHVMKPAHLFVFAPSGD